MKLSQWFRKFFTKPVDDVPDCEIIEDFYPVFSEREEVSFRVLMEEICETSKAEKLSRREVLCKMMDAAGINCHSRNDVSKFFWKKGISASAVKELTDEFMDLSAKANDDGRAA